MQPRFEQPKTNPIKQPQSVSYLLDAGVVLLLVGVMACSTAAAGLFPTDRYTGPSIIVLVLGVVSFSLGKLVARANPRNPKNETSSEVC